jgi:hypothetical protein
MVRWSPSAPTCFLVDGPFEALSYSTLPMPLNETPSLSRRLLVSFALVALVLPSACRQVLGVEDYRTSGGSAGGPSSASGVVTACGNFTFGAASATCGQCMDASCCIEAKDSIAGTACGFTMPNPASAGLPNPASYTENLLDGTVTDNVTGLTWAGAVEPTTVYTQGQAIRRCEDAGGGWRLPTRVELVSLVDFTFAKPGPTINAIFKNTPADKFWTSSHAACDPTIAWYVGFDNGSTHQERTDIAHRVRCVRGAPSNCSPTRYQVQADGSVHDAATELTWRQKVDPKQPWSDAMTFCPALGTGWRLPSLTELQTIVDETKENPPIDGDAFPNTPGDMSSYFWTSSPQAGPSGFAWYVVFIHGHADTEPVTSAFWVRCVR